LELHVKVEWATNNTHRHSAVLAIQPIFLHHLTTPVSVIALLKSTSSPPSFLALPVEIHGAISSHLKFLELHTLRLACHYFQSLIPPPTQGELLAIETTTFDFLACIAYTMLWSADMFSAKMVKKN
jgi:hypothetical protein